MKLDLHVHTAISACSNLDIRDILTYARRRGLDGVAITDHQSMDIRHEVKEGVQPDGLVIIFGQEYTTTEGDFLIFGPFEDLAPGLSAKSLLHLVDENRGAAVAAHPFRPGRSLNPALISDGSVQIMEAINGRDNGLIQPALSQWKKQFHLTVTGGSDAHSLEELGRVVTRFDTPVHSRDDLISALQSGHCRPEKTVFGRGIPISPPPAFSSLDGRGQASR